MSGIKKLFFILSCFNTTQFLYAHVLEDAKIIKSRMVQKEFQDCSKYNLEKKSIDTTISDFSAYLAQNENRSSANYTTHAFLLALRSSCEREENAKKTAMEASLKSIEMALLVDKKMAVNLIARQ